ncbi:hypothetical protein N7537_010452 [Penicillium hordei]|uniref:Uncharacterized protein n=1 Tax=Penicillium hordei TaxID=40994 RepID=A0AAD6GWP6_9EURO|nr:uncharacterized protein N7537_010452 [Penicillium hordei]KAJ5593548.1 hypothetical protein N7537_010452 [Penicillium hordei]
MGRFTAVGTSQCYFPMFAVVNSVPLLNLILQLPANGQSKSMLGSLDMAADLTGSDTDLAVL